MAARYDHEYRVISELADLGSREDVLYFWDDVSCLVTGRKDYICQYIFGTFRLH